MTQDEAQNAANDFRGWAVTARPSLLAHIGWELVGEAADGHGVVYGFSYKDMAFLVRNGRVRKLEKNK